MPSPPSLTTIDTMLGEMDGVMSAYLVHGDQPALVDTGAQTRTETVAAAVAEAGIGAHDLAWIVLTHIHLDHCGATGDLARLFPDAQVVVHPRGARHLVDPARLVEGSWAVYGDRAHMHGGLTAVDEARITVAEDGDFIPIGPGRSLRFVHAPGHANHHMVVLDEESGALMAGDALGVQFPGSSLYPAVPAPQFDLAATLKTLDRITEMSPTELLLGHFGSAGDVEQAISISRERQSQLASLARDGWREGGEEGVARAIADGCPVDSVVEDEAGRARWDHMNWAANNVGGLSMWAERESEVETPAGRP